MKILDNNECCQWLSSHHFEFNNPVRSERKDGFVSLPDNGYLKILNIPTESWTQMMLTQLLSHWVKGEEMTVFKDFRSTRGETRRQSIIWMADEIVETYTRSESKQQETLAMIEALEL